MGSTLTNTPDGRLIVTDSEHTWRVLGNDLAGEDGIAFMEHEYGRPPSELEQEATRNAGGGLPIGWREPRRRRNPDEGPDLAALLEIERKPARTV